MFDLRIPTGAFFAMIGIILLVVALFTDTPDALRVDLYCGLTMLAFGLFMLGMAWRARSRT